MKIKILLIAVLSFALFSDISAQKANRKITLTGKVTDLNTVRGVGSTGSTSPLFVVNGITVSSISGINPSIAKSIEVIKGPAASVYGLQGANGVISIHLKDGK